MNIKKNLVQYSSALHLLQWKGEGERVGKGGEGRKGGEVEEGMRGEDRRE